MRCRRRKPAADAAPPVKRRLVLAVGDFSADGIDPDRAYLIRGFRHELISCLIRFRDWVVLDQPSDSNGDAALAEGDTVYKIDATLLPGSGGVTLVLTLKDAESGHYVWSDRHNISLEEWFSAQQLIVRRIAVALNVNISAERLTRISGKPDISLDVYDRWLRGQSLSLQWRPEEETRAESIFRTIIGEAPGFAPAYSSLVQIMNSHHHIFPGRFRTREREKEALALAKKSVQLDPLDSKTHLCLAWAQAMNKQFEQAELSYTLAYELNENDPWTMLSSSHGLAFCDKPGDGQKAGRSGAGAGAALIGPALGLPGRHPLSLRRLRGIGGGGGPGAGRHLQSSGLEGGGAAPPWPGRGIACGSAAVLRAYPYGLAR